MLIIDENICVKEIENFEEIVLYKKNYEINGFLNNTFNCRKLSISIPFSNENSDNDSEIFDLPDLELIKDDFSLINNQDFNGDFTDEKEEEYIDNFS